MLAIAPLAATLAIGFQEAPAPFPKDLIHWRPIAANPVFTGELDDPSAWDHQIRERGWIAIEDGTYHLWYTGYRDADSRRVLGHATSTDGVDWVRDPANPVHDSSWVEDMCVVRDGGTLWMFAEGELDIAHLLSSSDDGESWTERGPLKIRQVDGTPIPPGPRGTPTVWVEDGVWSLFYERGDLSVWLARSDDPAHLVWTNVQDEPVLDRGPDRYDSEAVAANQVVKRDGVYYLTYHANSRRPWGDWTTCLARSDDLVHWEKYSGNPLIEANSSSGLIIDPDGDGPIPPRLVTMHPEVRVHVPTPAPSDPPDPR